MNTENCQKAKRERARNFTEEEKQTLLNIIPNYMHIVENKKTDCANVKEKKTAWNAIAEKFNASAKTGERTGIQVKALFDSLKKQAKRHLANDKSEIYKSGGVTSFISHMTLIDEQIIELLRPQMLPLANDFDSNSCFNESLENESNTEIKEEDVEEEEEEICQKTFNKTINFNEEQNSVYVVAETYKGNDKVIDNLALNEQSTSSTSTENNKRKISTDELLEMKRERHKKKMEILEIIKEKETIELEIKKIELNKLKGM